MNIENLKEYIKTTIKISNYRRLCEVLELDITSGEAKISQLKEMNRYFRHHKEGNKFIIDEIYELPKDKIDGRKNNIGKGNNKGKFKECKNFLVNKDNYNKTGVYKITLDNDIYIGSTIAGFRKRFQGHTYDDNKLPTKEMLKNGGEFKVLWIANNNESEKFIRDMENYYIKYYRNETDYNVINSNDAWSYTETKEKVLPENRYIKIKNENYNKALELLKINNLI